MSYTLCSGQAEAVSSPRRMSAHIITISFGRFPSQAKLYRRRTSARAALTFSTYMLVGRNAVSGSFLLATVLEWHVDVRGVLSFSHRQGRLRRQAASTGCIDKLLQLRAKASYGRD